MHASLDTQLDTRSTSGPAGEGDLHTIWQWNSMLPQTVNACVHQLICQRISYDDQAVCAWDGDLTYRELDDLSSRLAASLIGLGAGPEVIIPLCFEKSMWMPVAMMAVMKAGGASCALDVTQPEGRLRSIVKQIKPTIIISSKSSKGIADCLSGKAFVVTVDKESLERSPAALPAASQTIVTPENSLYVVFTSGSTGAPKGVVITHSNFSSALVHQNERLGFKRSTRTLDFASYAFDAAWYNTLHTLYAGACLCIPSEESRHNDLNGAIHQLRPNFANLTPKLCAFLDTESLGLLGLIELAGETADAMQVNRLRETTAVRFAYGPAECSILSTVSNETASCSNIGHGLGVRTWIVDSENDSLLAPLGSVGELWIEGPLVGQGYLRDDLKTTEAFIENPQWLAQGGPGYEGRSGRVYRTGDLVRYDSSNDGSLVFFGRKDAQVKIRGQRVELGEVEHQILESLPKGCCTQVVADVIKPKDSENYILVAFLASIETTQAATESMHEKLAHSVPSYMIPTFFVPVDEIPVAQTGKTDRRKMRELGTSLTLRQLSDMSMTRSDWRQPETVLEKELQALWAAALKVDIDSIGADDNFLRIGGDSIGAMRLVVAARKKQLSLTVADVFKQPRLCDLAEVIRTKLSCEKGDTDIQPFSLVKGDIASLCKLASHHCNINAPQIEDIFPCTPLQEGLMALTAKKTNGYVVRVVRQIQAGVDLNRFKASWEAVVARSPVLRTRVVDLGNAGLMQVVLHEAVDWTLATQLESYIHLDKRHPMELGTPLTRFGLVTEAESSTVSFVLTMHHAMCDGWSVPLLFDMAERIYHNELVENPPPFQGFIRHVQNLDQDEGKKTWRQQLQGIEAQPFPQLPTARYQPEPDAEVLHRISDLHWPAGNSTPATLIKAAWSVLIARHTSSAEVLFGATVSGRQAIVPGLEQMQGPTIATLPVRVAIDPNEVVKKLLERIQDQALDTTEFEQMGLQCIRRISDDAERACQFQTLVVIQPTDQNVASSALFEGEIDDVWDLGAFNPYALLLEFQPEIQGVQLRASFDPNLIERDQMQRMAGQFENVLRQLCTPGNGVKQLSAIVTTSKEDLCDLWEWNATVPQPLDMCVQDLVSERVKSQPEAIAISAWDGELKYCELETASDWVANELCRLGVEPGFIIPLCFEKSLSVPVMMLGVLKAGATFTMLSPSLPQGRIASLLNSVKPVVVITSPQHKELFGNTPIFSVEDLSVAKQETPSGLVSRRRGCWSTPAAVQFTSGTTGTPKGILLDHRCISTTAFSSYMFDISIYDTFMALVHGGCLCIPSEEDRENSLGASLMAFRATWVFLSPSVARAIPTASARTLKTLVLGGEALADTDVLKWADKVNTFNWYGPAECAMASHTPGSALQTWVLTPDNSSSRPEAETDSRCCSVKLSSWKTGSIGTSFNSNCWVTDTDNPNALVPIGTVGELVVQGPGLMRGYLNDREKTAAAFIVDPLWLLRGAPGHPGRRGRLYRTGDLVRRNADGSLTYVGRRDTQVKLRGQRVELGDVEHHVLQAVNAPDFPDAQVVAEVIAPQDTGAPMLVAFINFGKDNSKPQQEILPMDQSFVASLERRLAEALPRHMIPAVFLAVRSIPITMNGKLDRKKLRDLVRLLKPEQLSTSGSSISVSRQRQPETLVERQLQKLWGTILGTEAYIGAEDNFLQIGGDSIAAMRLVSAAREQGLSLTVSEIFRKPRLCDLAVVARPVGKTLNVVVERFSLLEHKLRHGSFIQEEIPLYLCAPMTVSDCFPVTSWQATCIKLATMFPPRQWNHFTIDLPAFYTRAKAVRLCEYLWDNMEILRMVFIQHGGVYFQVLTKDLRPTVLHFSTIGKIKDLTSRICEDDLQYPGTLGTPFTRFNILSGPRGDLRLVLRMSHAQYDSTTLLHMMRLLGTFSANGPIPRSGSFPGFLQHTAKNESSCRSYWSSFLRSSSLSKLEIGSRAGDSDQTTSPIAVQKLVRMPISSEGYTPATIFTAACAIVIANQSKSSDVTFGRLVSGRAMLPFPLRDTAGPCLNIIPVRVRHDSEHPLKNALKLVHQQHIDSLVYDTIGFDHIVKYCTDWPDNIKHFGCVTHYQDLGDAEADVAGANLQLTPFEGRAVETRLMEDNVVMISAKPTGGELRLELAVSGGHYAESQLCGWMESLGTIIEAFQEG
ncbi:putative Carrier domain-containing protein [Seiridium cardinale]|uniref:Carrier domain-containing protein n=1 Tax=Seiridium cardinale TaxID=138064 RepID=A0ABR2XX39_9PEZI